jgi:hypothetical protein
MLMPTIREFAVELGDERRVRRQEQLRAAKVSAESEGSAHLHFMLRSYDNL